MTPIFLTKNIKDTGYGKPMGQEDEHLKLFVKQNQSQGFPAIGFGLGKKLDLVKNQQPFDMIFSIEENQWNGTTTIQLQIRDIK